MGITNVSVVLHSAKDFVVKWSNFLQLFEFYDLQLQFLNFQSLMYVCTYYNLISI